jgi:Xaa-Pro aminopeptidase
MPTLLLFGDTERSAAMRHEVPIAILDPFLFADVEGRSAVLTTRLDRDRIAGALPGAELFDMFELGLKELIVQDGHSRTDAIREVVTRAVRRLGVKEAIVPGDFPLAIGDRLRAAGVSLVVDDAAVEARRRSKAPHELDGIRAAQRAAEAGIEAAAALLAAAERGAGDCLHVDGTELHAEDVRSALRSACAANGAVCPPDVIVASVWNGSGHEPGSGPLPAGLPIQIDLWPRDEATGCWADMTRTFVVGEPTDEHARLIVEQEDLVRAALDDARAAIRPGATGRELYDAACDRFEAAGHRTQRTGPGDDRMEGFQFALGHGVGLEVHESPVLGLAGTSPLVAGDVIAIEPGLWDRRIGGVRYEDLLLVTDTGCELLTDYPYDLTPRPRERVDRERD